MNAGPLVLPSVVFSQKPQPAGWAASLQVNPPQLNLSQTCPKMCLLDDYKSH